MKALAHEVEVTAVLKLTKRELQLLHHITRYDNKRHEYLRGMESSHYSGGVTAQELESFFDGLQRETSALMDSIEDAKKKLFPAR